MNKLDIAIALLEEARDERERLEKLNGELDKLRSQGIRGTDYLNRRYLIEAGFQPVPHKAHINDNIKVARRILLGEYMK